MHVIYFFIPVKLRYARPSNNIHSDTTWRWISILELCYCYWEYYHILLYSNIISWSWRLIRNPTRTASMLSLDYILDAAWRLKHDKEKWYYFIDFFFLNHIHYVQNYTHAWRLYLMYVFNILRRRMTKTGIGCILIHDGVQNFPVSSNALFPRIALDP